MTWFPRWLSPPISVRAKVRLPLPRRVPLSLECLEERTLPASVFVVPLTVPVDATHFHSLSAALPVAGNQGAVTIEPDATPETLPVLVTQTAVVIQGDPNIPGDILPSFDLNIAANNVSLLNLHLGTVTISAGVGTTTVEGSLVNTITETGGATLDGNNTITQNQITGSITLNGNASSAAARDSVTFNTLTGTTNSLLTVADDTGALIQFNNFIGEGSGQTAITLVSGGTLVAPVVLANNTISLNGSQAAGITLRDLFPTFAQVLNNTIHTNNLGYGLAFVSTLTDQGNYNALVQGNDFHGNAIGVTFSGSNNAIVNVDLGGGTLGSLGGNDFRSFTAQGTVASAAIQMFGTSLGATLSAQNNIFLSTVAPNNVIDDRNSGAGTGTGDVDISAALSPNRSLVQTLYNNVLGRTGSLGELDYWVSLLNANNQATVVNGILRSSEGLGRIVDSYYLQYLGRQSDPDGRNYWIGRLQAGVSEENVIAGFASSPEFLAHIDTDFVQALYRQTFNRTGNASELAYWNNLLPTLGLQGVAAGFTTSTENRDLGVANSFQRFLHHGSSSMELSNLTGLPIDLLTLEADVLASAEFFTNG